MGNKILQQFKEDGVALPGSNDLKGQHG